MIPIYNRSLLIECMLTLQNQFHLTYSEIDKDSYKLLVIQVLQRLYTVSYGKKLLKTRLLNWIRKKILVVLVGLVHHTSKINLNRLLLT